MFYWLHKNRHKDKNVEGQGEMRNISWGLSQYCICPSQGAVPGYLVKEIWMIRAENVVTGPLEIFEKARRIYKTDLIMAFVCFSCRLRWGGEGDLLKFGRSLLVPTLIWFVLMSPALKTYFVKLEKNIWDLWPSDTLLQDIWYLSSVFYNLMHLKV